MLIEKGEPLKYNVGPLQKFKGHNFNVWKERMIIISQYKCLLRIVTDMDRSEPGDENGIGVFYMKNRKVLTLIKLFITNDMFP